HAAFALLARQVKAWAKARGLDSAPFGGLPGPAWAVLAARTVREAGEQEPTELLRRFFGSWATWDWHHPVALTGPPVRQRSEGVTVLTPTAPVRSCTEQVSAGGLALLGRELLQAWELLEPGAERRAGSSPQAGAGCPRELLSAPPLHRRHAAWALLTVRPPRPEEFEETLGRVRGRLPALL
ncbi:poly(A) polymerase, partial [Streptomyces sp. LS1784]|uniref:poly(A) polymerase n=1 Tax=Streptomyces sp. LS1784 TaxID=2851533 RepID=UPI0027DF9580